MSYWIRVFARDSLLDLDVETLSQALDDADFVVMAENHGLDAEDGDAAQDLLRFEKGPRRRKKSGWIVLMHHEPEDAHGIPVELWADPEQVAEEVEEVRGSLDRLSPAGRARVEAVLAEARETVGFELKAGRDLDGMGYPIAFQLAMWLAERARGLVDVDSGREWWDPETYCEVGG